MLWGAKFMSIHLDMKCLFNFLLTCNICNQFHSSHQFFHSIDINMPLSRCRKKWDQVGFRYGFVIVWRWNRSGRASLTQNCLSIKISMIWHWASLTAKLRITQVKDVYSGPGMRSGWLPELSQILLQVSVLPNCWHNLRIQETSGQLRNQHGWI